ncbi:hypothetical protein [Burkholderia gladioli]|uniref:hypothetical protein n=1 Tax=Burkholderia gladioli TaxID=28095 RepID=UPI00163EF823|nr:hypothetical protein [Burkholderia gladioli]
MNISTSTPIHHRLLISTWMSAALACGRTTNVSGGIATSKPFPPGAQAPKLPHPGTIAVKYAWNHSEALMPAGELPESFIFHCADANGNPAKRDSAAWCIPVVEIDTVSTNAHGHPIAPNDATSITTSTYGPGHTFIEHLVSGASPAK